MDACGEIEPRRCAVAAPAQRAGTTAEDRSPSAKDGAPSNPPLAGVLDLACIGNRLESLGKFISFTPAVFHPELYSLPMLFDCSFSTTATLNSQFISLDAQDSTYDVWAKCNSFPFRVPPLMPCIIHPLIYRSDEAHQTVRIGDVCLLQPSVTPGALTFSQSPFLKFESNSLAGCWTRAKEADLTQR